MVLKSSTIFFVTVLVFQMHTPRAQTWLRAGYWLSDTEFPVSDINAALFTHLLGGFAELINSTSYELLLSPADTQRFNNFTNIVKHMNPSITTLLSIGGGNANYSILSSMVSNFSYRKAFIDSTIRIARLNGFDGLDFCWVSANSSSDMSNMGKLFQEWREAADFEAKISGKPLLVLTAAVQYTPDLEFASFPVDSIRSNLNWVNVLAYDYYMPTWANFTGAHAALYDPSGNPNTDDGIGKWVGKGLPASMLVLALPFYGYAWTLKNPKDSAVGAPAIGPAISKDGSLSYKAIKAYIQRNGANSFYNATYVMNYCVIGSTWIGYDDVETLKVKVSYVKQKRLLGYFVWLVSYDENWELSSLAAAQELGNEQHQNRKRLLLIILTTIATVIVLLLVLAFMFYRRLKLRGARPKSNVNNLVGGEDFSGNTPNLHIFSFTVIEAATNKFAFVNKLGQGGYGPVYKGVLPNGQEIAVKRLSKTSRQGFEEFKNEVLLTARLQHINLVKVLGYCVDTDEQMLIYEFMPNKSLDFYLFCPDRGYLLNWRKRVAIIEGVTQGLLYLQEYSRLTIIHRDLKPSNILLDENMKPKISDFGMARIFTKDELEANTSQIAGTYGYVPPEYVKKGIYSTKSDVYSFGVLLLQIISGKKTAQLYGVNENLNLLAYAFELWKAGIGMEFMDPSLDDTDSTFKLTRCMQIALLCVQENADDRPSMLEISSMLKNTAAELKTPEKPAFYGEETQENQHSAPLDRQTQSFCDPTVSEVIGR